jgi:hypothetical protein
MYGSKGGSPKWYFKASIYATNSSGAPTGTALANSTTSYPAFSITTEPTRGWFNFTFNNFTVVYGTRYAINIYPINGSDSIANYAQVGFVTSGGNWTTRRNSVSAWVTQDPTSTAIMKIFGHDYVPAGAYPQILVKVYDSYNNNSVEQFRVKLENGTTYYAYSGTAAIPVVNGNWSYNITHIYDNSTGQYFNLTGSVGGGYTWTNAPTNNTNYTKLVYPWQSQISFTGYRTILNTSVPASWYINNTLLTTSYKRLRAGSYKVVGVNSSYFNKTKYFTVTALDNKTINVTEFYNYYLRVFYRDAANDTILTDVNTTLFSPKLNRTYLNENNKTVFYFLNGYAYTLQTDPANYSVSNTTFNASTYTTPTNTTAYILHYSSNIVIMYFYDELNYSLVTENITIELISDIFSNTYYTTTGSKTVSLLAPTDYNIRYRATGYAPRNYFFTLVNGSYSLLNLTMLQLGEGENVTINLYDNLQNKIVGARIKVLKYIVPTNSFKIVDIRETNFEGQTVVYMQLNTEYYEFIVEYDKDDNGVLETILTTDPTYIYSTTINLFANLFELGFNSLFEQTGLYGVITFNSTNRNATYTFDDAAGTATQGCIYAYRLVLGERTFVNSTCASGAAGTAITKIPNVNATYELRGYIIKDSTNYFITMKTVVLGGTTVFSNDDSLFFSAVIIIAMFFLGFFAIEIGVILAGLATMILSFVGMLNVPRSVTIPIFALSLILAFIINKSRGST